MAVTSRRELSWSIPVTASFRSTGMPAARLAESLRTLCSPPEQGNSPAARAVIAASQSIAAMPSFTPWMTKRLVKPSRRRKVPLAMSSPTPASSA